MIWAYMSSNLSTLFAIWRPGVPGWDLGQLRQPELDAIASDIERVINSIRLCRLGSVQVA